MATADIEIWESNVAGRISMHVPGPRDTLKPLTVLGKGQRLRISPGDRIVVEEGIRDLQNNPFVNGQLSQVGGPTREKTEAEEELGLPDQQMSDDVLAGFFSLEPDDFTSALHELSEVNVRRLQTLFRDKAGTVRQQEIIKDYIDEKWPITSGDTASYREMRSEPSR